MLTSEEAIAMFQKRCEANPQDYLSASVLGQLYMRHAREEHDEDAFGTAEAVFRRALEINPQHFASRVHLANALNSQHKFAEAAAEAEQCLEKKPRSELALAALGDAQLELGQYEAARETFAKLEAESSSPPVWARLARLAELEGEIDAAQALLERSLAHVEEKSVPVETVWYRFRLGDFLFRIGELELADAQLSTALELNPDHHPSLITLSRVRSAQNRHQAAIGLLRQVVDLTPHFDLVAELSDLYELAGDDQMAAETLHKATETAASIEDVTLEGRHLALFYADHNLEPELAAKIAREDLARRQDVYAWDTLAWTLCQNNEFDEAIKASEHALRLGTRDAQIYFHRAMIHSKRGEEKLARQWIAKVAELNPAFSPTHHKSMDRLLATVHSL